MFAMEGGSVGFQIGGQATDFVLLVMNEKGANSVMSSKVKLGADASAAAGPVGRTASAETDLVMKAEILSWSKSRGVFGGVSLEGSTLRSDDGANKNLRFFADCAAKKWPCGQQKSGAEEVRSQDLHSARGMCLAATHARLVE